MTPRQGRSDSTPQRGESNCRGRRSDNDATPLQARGPDPRSARQAEKPTGRVPAAGPAGGSHHDEAPDALVQPVGKQDHFERARPKDTGRTGA